MARSVPMARNAVSICFLPTKCSYGTKPARLNDIEHPCAADPEITMHLRLRGGRLYVQKKTFYTPEIEVDLVKLIL